LIRDKAALGSQQEKELVAFTIYSVLKETLKMLATICPYISEQMFLNLKEAFNLEEESIHLHDWPSAKESLIDTNLEQEMETAENMIQSTLAGREKIQRGVRWPIKEIIIVTKDKDVKNHVLAAQDIIKSQTNVKDISIVNRLETVLNSVKSDFKTLGPEFGETAAKIIAKLTQESADTIISHIEKDGVHKMQIDGNTIELKKEHLIFERKTPENLQESQFRQGFVYLNKEMDEDLEAEGFSRELMRRVQSLRKKSGMEKKDNIILVVKADEELVEYFKKWQKQIEEKCGSDKTKISTDNPARKIANYSKEKVKGREFEIWLEKVN
jgi:isoleucyl-tRNA synthetase